MRPGGEVGLDAWALPSEVGPFASAPVEGTGGLRRLSLDAQGVLAIAERLERAREALAARPAAELARQLGRVGGRFLDPADPLRSTALDLLPTTSGLSGEMSAAVLDGMAADWVEERLAMLLKAELGMDSALDRFVEGAGGRSLAVGPRLTAQFVSGSVPGVGVGALLRSLLLKSPTLLKPGLGDVVLPVLFALGLRDADPELADALAVVYWPGGSRPLEDAALARADTVVAYGADETVAGLRARTPITTRFVAYHHRVSVGVVGRAALAADRSRMTALEIAGAVAFFDQRGCVSPQVIYVEEAGAVEPHAFASQVAEALSLLEDRLPTGRLEPGEVARVQQLRATAEALGASGSGTALLHGGRANWTVVYDPDDQLEVACVGRVVRVVPLVEASALPSALEHYEGHLQSVGYAGLGGGLEGWATALARMGASRVAPFSSIPFPPPWWHHDGGGPLRDLVRWVDLEEA